MENNIYIKIKFNMFERNCPCCNKKLFYKQKWSMMKQERLSKMCKSCTVKLEYKLNPEKNRGASNGRTGKSLIDIMIQKYGESEANEKYSNWKSNKNTFGSGQSNPQYGKSPFKNGGMSYKGWYNGIFFRSSFELMFLYEMSDKKVLSAEGDRFKVKYDRFFYHPDFFIEELNTVYEVKSKQWLYSQKNQDKISAAIPHFSGINIGYEIITEDELSIFKQYNRDWQKVIYEFLYDLVISKKVILCDISMKKLENKLEKTKRTSKLITLKSMK